jgi:hypothetical protein
MVGGRCGIGPWRLKTENIVIGYKEFENPGVVIGGSIASGR